MPHNSGKLCSTLNTVLEMKTTAFPCLPGMVKQLRIWF